MTYRRSWAELRAEGFRRCEWVVHRSRGPDEDKLTQGRSEGNRCSAMVPREQWEESDVAICHNHLQAYQDHQDARRLVKNIMRQKYDPGPLYEE